MFFKAIFAFLFSGILLVASSYAQRPDNAVEQLSVREAIKLAHAIHPAINEMRGQIQVKRGERMMSYGIRATMVSFFREGIGDGMFEEQGLSFLQIIDFPLTSYYRVAQVRTEQNALELRLESVTRSVTAGVKKAYTDLQYAQELVRLREEQVRLFEDLVAAARLRVEVGEASELESLKAEIQHAEALSGLEQSRRQFQHARYELLGIVGINPDTKGSVIVFPDSIPYVEVNIDESMMHDRIEAQPEFRSASSSLDAARVGVKRARSYLLPALQIEVFPQDFGSGYNRYGFQVGLRLSLWGNHYRGGMHVAKASVQNRSWEKQAVLIELKKQAEQAWHSFQTSKRTIDRHVNEVKVRAARLLRQTQEGYRAGELDILTLLDTQRTYLASELRYYDALRDYYFQLITLERFVGEELVYGVE